MSRFLSFVDRCKLINFNQVSYVHWSLHLSFLTLLEYPHPVVAEPRKTSKDGYEVHKGWTYSFCSDQ